ncbi:threonine/serine exporter ThrE family protein [Oryzobacter terrae]|uniref:threonine/serine ThrE exporter family protein n=1 Tax=Oryzobacter terrae TaxID=1620385 RepID=UPI00366C4B6B
MSTPDPRPDGRRPDWSGDPADPSVDPTARQPRPRRSGPRPAVDREAAVRPARDRRARLILGESPTEPMPMADLLRRTPYRYTRIPNQAAEDAKVRAALDLAVRVGELMLRCGAGAPQVQGSVAAVAAASGVDLVEVDITLQSLLVQATSSDGRPHTLLRVVRSNRHDYARLVAVHQLVEELTAGEIEPSVAAERLRSIKRHPRNFPAWAVSAANAVLASAVAVMIGASPLAAVATVAVVLVVTGVSRLHNRIDLPEFYGNAINAVVATLLAGGVYAVSTAAGLGLRERDFAFIVAGGIVAMLPGRTMASAIEDVLFGFPLTGAGRLLAVFLALLGIVIGVAGGLSALLTLTEAIGSDFVSPSVLDLRSDQSAVLAALGGALFVGLAGAVTVQSRRRLVLASGVLAVAAAGTAALLNRGFGIGIITATGVAAVALGVVGRVVANRLGAPSMVVVIPASFGLLPGLTIFRGLYELVAQSGGAAGSLSIQSGITTLLGAGAVLLAIASGTVLGEILAAPWDRTRGPATTDNTSSP